MVLFRAFAVLCCCLVVVLAKASRLRPNNNHNDEENHRGLALYEKKEECIVYFHNTHRQVDEIKGRTSGYWTDSTIRFLGRDSKGYSPEYFQTHRWGSHGFRYEIPLGDILSDEDSAPSFIVRLGFAEVYRPNCNFGKRIMDITVNGQEFVSGLDVYQRVGCFSGLVLEKEFELSGSTIDVEFTASKENPMVSFVEIESVACSGY